MRMMRGIRLQCPGLQGVRLSLFEKVILVNSLLLIGGALAGLWVTSHTVEAHHYLIDTSFIVAVTVLSLLLNVLLIRASFRPLFSLLATIRAVRAGHTQARAHITRFDSEIGELASAFNSMLDWLEQARREQGILILQAQEEERRRLALELHDESSQNLTALLVHLEILTQALHAFPDGVPMKEIRERLGAGFAALAEITQKTLETLRTLALQLRPSVLDDLGLHAALRWLVQDAQQRLQLAVDLQIEEGASAGAERRTPAPCETALFRIAQESLTNIARHAHAQHVSMTLRQDQHTIRLRIQDNGCGYDASKPHSGLGLFGMHERATLLGGTLTVVSEPGQGTTVETLLPETRVGEHV